MKANRAFFAGMTGGIALTVLMLILRGLGWMDINFELTLGTLATFPNLNAWIVGFFLHVFLAGVFALAYGEFFELAHKAGVSMGLLVGFVQAVMMGLILGVLPAFHPRIPGEVQDPGFFAAGYGASDVIWFFAIHLVFGLIVSVLYEEPIHAAESSYART